MREAGCSDDGVCALPSGKAVDEPSRGPASGRAVIYFGDPMCSWCWGISPQLHKLRAWCSGAGVPFELVMGGLRAGGGEAWDARFRNFLRHHWREVAAATGQTFNTGLLESDRFDYDTEPACRAVVCARLMGVGDELAWFSEVQRGFYVDNEDPKEPRFYAARCAGFGLDPDAFVARFESDAARTRVAGDFAAARQAGITGFPTIAVRAGDGLTVIATGFATFERLRDAVRRVAEGRRA